MTDWKSLTGERRQPLVALPIAVPGYMDIQFEKEIEDWIYYLFLILNEIICMH